MTEARGLRLAHDWLDAPLPENVVLGEASWLYSVYAFLHYRSTLPIGVRVGAHSGIYDGTFFELGTHGQVDIGQYCSIVGATFCANGAIDVGDYVFIAHEVVIAADEIARPHDQSISSIRRGPKLGDDVWVGMGATIVGGVDVGHGSVVAAQAVVTTDVPAHVVVAGNPATIVKHLDSRVGQAGVPRPLGPRKSMQGEG